MGSEVERSEAEGSEVVGSRWQGVGVWYVLVFKTRSSAINSPGDICQPVAYVLTVGGGGRGGSGATLSIKIFTMCRKLLNFLATQTP